MVGVSGPFLASQAFRNFTSGGVYPSPATCSSFRSGYIQRKFPNPFAEQASLELESSLGRGWILTTGYQYVHGMKMPVYLSVNGLPDGTLPDGRQAFTPADPRFGFALIATPSGFSIYNGGIVSLRKNFASHYSVLANYTYSKSIDIATDVQLTDHAARLSRSQCRSRRRGQRHPSPVCARTSWRKPAALAGLPSQLQTVDAQHAAKSSILLDPRGLRCERRRLSLFRSPEAVGRNSYRGAPYYDTDMRLQRVFSLGERLKAVASMEAFNLLNHVNVQNIDQVYGAADFLGPVPAPVRRRHWQSGQPHLRDRELRQPGPATRLRCVSASKKGHLHGAYLD